MMNSVLEKVSERKKVRRFGEVEVVTREAYAELDVDGKVELIRALVPLGLLHVQELLDEEIRTLAGERYARKDACTEGRRHGSNPGSVRMAGQRVPVRVPRVRRAGGGEVPLRSYAALRGTGDVDDLLLLRVLYGISCRNYEAAAEAIPGAIGLSSSTVSRRFIQASATKLRELQERDLSREDVAVLVLDGKTFGESTLVVALGITLSGDKRFLGFVETDTENAQVLTPFLRSLLERGLDISQGLLVLLDGGKGLRSAVDKAFRDRALVQRCQWHKRENVVRYLAKSEQASWRRRLQRAYQRPTYQETREALRRLHQELDERNQSAASSLAEGLEETLTLHRLGVYGLLGRSLTTTNCLESIHAMVEERCGKVDHWKNSGQRHRWLATALADIEPRLRKVQGYRHLSKLREAVQRALRIGSDQTAREVA
jgi:transposase-like protein